MPAFTAGSPNSDGPESAPGFTGAGRTLHRRSNAFHGGCGQNERRAMSSEWRGLSAACADQGSGSGENEQGVFHETNPHAQMMRLLN